MLRFETEARVEFFAEPLVALDDRLAEAEDRLGVHGDLVGGFARLLLSGGPLEAGLAERVDAVLPPFAVDRDAAARA